MNFSIKNFDIGKKYENQRFTIFAVVGCFVFVSAIFAFWHWKNSQHHEAEIEFQITNPWRENLEIKKEYVAQIRSAQHIELRSMEKGYLQNIYVDEGQFVKKGQKMFQIMPLLLEAELKKAKAEYQLAKIEYDNTLMLHKKNVVSVNELALVKARLDKSHAEMEVAQAHLQFSTVKAPFDGIMDRFQVRLGSLIDEGQLLTTISDNSKMWLYFNVSEADYLDYMQKKNEKEASLELVLANGELFAHSGKVDTIEADFNNENGNVAFRATFPNPDKLLRHGETGTVLLSKKYDDVLVIPQKATFEVLDKKFVYVIDEKNEVSAREVKIVAEVQHLFIIATGLSENDKILLEGLGKVHEGDEVKTQFQDRESVKKSLELSTK
jgi:membrane fusion protein (multidrug efflux system)